MWRKNLKVIGLILIAVGLFTPLVYGGDVIIEQKIEQKEIIKKEEAKSYFALIEIPKINLKKELFPKGDAKNNLNINLYVHDKSIFPPSSNSNLIIAGHSGNGKNAYFKNLYKLKVNDIVKISYNNYSYTYKIKEIEEQAKTGTLYLKEEYAPMLTLITCTKNNKNTQTIYYASLQESNLIA